MITVVTNGSVLDSRSLEYSGEGDVVVEDGIIRQVGGRHTGTADVTIDARGKYVMPEIGRAHV